MSRFLPFSSRDVVVDELVDATASCALIASRIEFFGIFSLFCYLSLKKKCDELTRLLQKKSLFPRKHRHHGEGEEQCLQYRGDCLCGLGLFSLWLLGKHHLHDTGAAVLQVSCNRTDLNAFGNRGF